MAHSAISTRHIAPNPASVTIRSARVSDAAEISSLVGRTWSHLFKDTVSPSDLEAYLTGPLSVAQLEADIDNPRMRLIVASTSKPDPAPLSSADKAGPKDDLLLGVAQLVLGSTIDCLTLTDPVELQRLYVSVDHHGSGVAKLLLERAESTAREEGAKSMWLGMYEDNPRAKGFYEKVGFKVVGEKTFMVGTTKRRDLVFEKAL